MKGHSQEHQGDAEDDIDKNRQRLKDGLSLQDEGELLSGGPPLCVSRAQERSHNNEADNVGRRLDKCSDASGLLLIEHSPLGPMLTMNSGLRQAAMSFRS